MRKCSMCGIELETPSPEEEKEMREELNDGFPGCAVEDCDVVCDDCYKKVLRSFN